MIYTRQDLLTLLHETGALRLWNRERGPVYWYIANVPGPFYLNTEVLIGASASARILADIDAILAENPAAADRAKLLETGVMSAFLANPVWRRLVETMLAKAAETFPENAYNFVSGGERRDWLFSIPFAREAGFPHAFLFKDGSLYSNVEVPERSSGLHIADLINNAASYTGMWLPMLTGAGYSCAMTLCINSRGEAGLTTLERAGVRAISLQHIGPGFFAQSHEADLISSETRAEIELFFNSAKDWASKYLVGRPSLFQVATCDPKSFARMRHFFENDPWEWRVNHPEFFSTMRREIETRTAKS